MRTPKNNIYEIQKLHLCCFLSNLTLLADVDAHLVPVPFRIVGKWDKKQSNRRDFSLCDTLCASCNKYLIAKLANTLCEQLMNQTKPLTTGQFLNYRFSYAFAPPFHCPTCHTRSSCLLLHLRVSFQPNLHFFIFFYFFF